MDSHIEGCVISDPTTHAEHFRNASRKFRTLEDEALAKRLGSEEWDAKKVFNLKRHHTLRDGYLAAKAQHELETQEYLKLKAEIDKMEVHDRSYSEQMQRAEQERMRLERQEFELGDRAEVLRLQTQEEEEMARHQAQLEADVAMAQELSSQIDVMETEAERQDRLLAEKLEQELSVVDDSFPPRSSSEDRLLAEKLEQELAMVDGLPPRSSSEDRLFAEKLQQEDLPLAQPADAADTEADRLLAEKLQRELAESSSPQPQPEQSLAATECTDDDEFGFDVDAADLSGLRHDDKPTARQRLLEEQQEALKRIELERQDEEFARRLQEEAALESSDDDNEDGYNGPESTL